MVKVMNMFCLAIIRCVFRHISTLYTVELTNGKMPVPASYEYEMSTDRSDYWWWDDGLYMVMPVMTKLYKVTGNPLYLEKLHEYWEYANSIMYDAEAGLYYRERSMSILNIKV